MQADKFLARWRLMAAVMTVMMLLPTSTAQPADDECETDSICGVEQCVEATIAPDQENGCQDPLCYDLRLCPSTGDASVGGSARLVGDCQTIVTTDYDERNLYAHAAGIEIGFVRVTIGQIKYESVSVTTYWEISCEFSYEFWIGGEGGIFRKVTLYENEATVNECEYSGLLGTSTPAPEGTNPVDLDDSCNFRYDQPAGGYYDNGIADPNGNTREERSVPTSVGICPTDLLPFDYKVIGDQSGSTDILPFRPIEERIAKPACAQIASPPTVGMDLAPLGDALNPD